MNALRLIVFCFAAIASSSVLAGTFVPAKLVFKDGKILKGLAKPLNTAIDTKITFKANEKEKETDYDSDLLKNMVFYYDDETVEYDRVKYYGLMKGKIFGPAWLEVLERGYATLYFTIVEGRTVVRASGSSMEPADKYWLCYRPGEEAASNISWVIGKVNANGRFKVKGYEYFKDYPELAEKIKTKIYKWDNIREVVKEYNAWKGKK